MTKEDILKAVILAYPEAYTSSSCYDRLFRACHTVADLRGGERQLGTGNMTSIEASCLDNSCEVKADVVVNPKQVDKATKDLEKIGETTGEGGPFIPFMEKTLCKVFERHEHEPQLAGTEASTHLHLLCMHGRPEDSISIIRQISRIAKKYE